MKVFTKLKNILINNRLYFGHLGLLVLFLLGLMNVVNILGFRSPSDGVEWEANPEGRPMVSGLITTDAELSFQIGDVLISINDVPVEDLDSLKTLLEDAKIGGEYLYIIERAGEQELEPWVVIKGLRDDNLKQYFPLALTGFLYLSFLLLIMGQKVVYGSRLALTLLCLCVFLKFAFHHTERFTDLDYIVYFLDDLGEFLLPSALAAVAISRALSGARWAPFVQALHWFPSVLLLLFKYLFLSLFIEADITKQFGADLMNDLEMIQHRWAGGLMIVALLMLTLIAEMRAQERSFSFFWVVAWLPFSVRLLGVDLPFLRVASGVTPIILPIALLVRWSRHNALYLGEIAKKGIVYFSVVFVLLLGYALFIIAFQALLGDKINSAAHATILGIAIMFAVISYTPAKRYSAETLERIIYGKRLESIRLLTDFSTLNRADTRIDVFLFNILGRIKKAFLVEKGSVYMVGENSATFHSIEPLQQHETFIFTHIPPSLLAGDIVRGHEASARLLGTDEENPFGPNDFICPIRVSDELGSLIVFSLEGNNPRLNPDEERQLKALLHQCDVLMENMELYHAVTQKAISINQLKEYNENIIESSRLGILTTDEMDRAVSCNNALVELAGIPRDEVMGKTFERLFQPMALTNQRRVKSGHTLEGRFENVGGELVTLEIQETPLKTKENEVYGTLYLIEDIQEKKEFNEKMMQQEKLASIGLLAAGVAHEINTPLTGIDSYSQLLAADPRLGEDGKELAELIQTQSQRAARIVSELLNFSRKESLPKGPVDLDDVLSQTLRFLSHQIGSRKVLVTVHEPNAEARIEGYANQVQQVFVNLIVNAMDAMPNGGTLEIRLRVGTKTIEVSFKDSGTGMNEHVRNHLFDPFFTTKEVGKGTGLGLAVVYNILQDHGAGVRVISEEGQGTTFRLSFARSGPRTQAEKVMQAENRIRHEVIDAEAKLC